MQNMLLKYVLDLDLYTSTIPWTFLKLEDFKSKKFYI